MEKRSLQGWFALLVACGITACGADGRTLDPSVCPPQPLYHFGDDGEMLGPDGKPLSDSERRAVGIAENAGCITKAGHATTEPGGAGGSSSSEDAGSAGADAGN